VPYIVELLPVAARQFRKLPENVRAAVARRIDVLADDPRAVGCEKLAGYPDLYRVRVGDYRIVYGLSDRLLLVLVVKVGSRADVYERIRKEDLSALRELLGGRGS
jgi:mRNA interferase RelE/StbE